MAQVVTARTNMSAFTEAMKGTEDWPDAKKEAFAKEWFRLVECGAQTADVVIHGMTVTAFPSEDLARHCAKWGLKSWQV